MPDESSQLDTVLQELSQQIQPLQASKDIIRRIRDAYNGLDNHTDLEEHWLHENVQPAAALLLLAAYMDSHACASRLVASITADIRSCPQCVVMYHSAKATMGDLHGASVTGPALQRLQAWDESRITAAICRAHANPEAEIGEDAVTALFESLSFELVLDDEGVMSEMEKAFMKLSTHHDLALTEGGRYPGVYKLLAHESSGLRSLISPIVRSLGRFEEEVDVDGIFNVVQGWIDTLTGSTKGGGQDKGRPRHTWHVQPTWQALNVVLGLMSEPALLHLLHRFPDLLPLILNFAQQGDPVSWAGLACLASISQNAGPQVLSLLHPDLALVNSLASVAVNSMDARLQIFVVQALKAILLAVSSSQSSSTSRQFETLQSRILFFFLDGFQQSRSLKIGSKELAQQEGFKKILKLLQSNRDIALLAHIFGPHLCRQLNPSVGHQVDTREIMMDLAENCLQHDAEILHTTNANSRPTTSHLAPCLWQGLANTGNIEILVMLVHSAGKIAHTPAGELKNRQQKNGEWGHFRDVSGAGRIDQSLLWPRLTPGDEHDANPHAIKADDAPGLLLQTFRQVVTGCLEKNPISEKQLQFLQNETPKTLIKGLFRNLVGIHTPLRKAAESSLIDVTASTSVQQACGVLFRSSNVVYGYSSSIFGALKEALADISSQPLNKAMVGGDMQALLATAVQVLQAAKDTAKDSLRGQRQFVDACWHFVLRVLAESQQIGQLTVARSNLQKLFTLLPMLWEIRMDGSLTSTAPKTTWRLQLGFMTALISWGSLISVSVVPAWKNAVQNVLRHIPGQADLYLPYGARRAGHQALLSSSTTPDEIKLFLASILGASAPGNLGKSALDFTSKPAASLPQAAVAKPGGRNFGQKSWVKAEPGIESDKAEALVNPESLIDLTASEEEEEGIKARALSGQEASTSKHRDSSLESHPDISLEDAQKDFGYDSDVPLQQYVSNQRALWNAAKKQTQHRKEPWREQGETLQPPNRAQKTLATFVSISPHKKGDEKSVIPPPSKDRLGGVALESIWKSAKQAKDEVQNREALKAVQNVAKPKGKSKLKAMIEKEDTALKDANRRIARAEREEGPVKGQGRPSPDEDEGVLRAVNRNARSGQHKASTARPSHIQADDHLESELHLAKNRVALPSLDRKSLLPAAPRPVRKAIQLSQDPGMHAQAAKRKPPVLRPQSYEKVLSLEKVQQDILSWDMTRVMARHSSDDLAQIPDSFQNLEQYARTFWRLMHEELRAHIQQACEEGPDAGRKKSRGSAALSIPFVVHEIQRRSTLHWVDFVFSAGDREACRADDFVILTRTPMKESVNLMDMNSLHVFGLVIKIENHEGVRGQKIATVNVNLLTRLPGGSNARLEAAQKSLLQGTTWHCTTILSWIPHHRQFQALCNVHTLPADLVHQLVAPSPPSRLSPPALASRLPDALTRVLMRSYNTSQYSAIKSACLSDSQFTLIQGPPGTGKTSTVIGIISALLASKQAPPPTSTAPSLGPSLSKPLRPNPAKTASIPNPGPKAPSFRVLVCAQSNAAIDELIMRLADPGLFNLQGSRRVPAMVRLGKMDSTHESVKMYHIDAMSLKTATTDQSLAAVEAATSAAEQEVLNLREKLNEARKALDTAEAKQNEADPTPENKMKSLRDNRRRLAIQLKNAKDKVVQGSEQRAKARKEVRQAVVQKAEVVTCTLSSAGGDLLTLSKGSLGFQALIIDEAAQAVEPSALIAFQLLAPEAKIVMVGDPQQLPPTVLSRAAEAAKLSQSLFQRLQQAKWPVTMLSEQFRMHPKISSWPSSYFYAKKLVDGAVVKSNAWAADFHSHPCFPPLAFFNCIGGRESSARGGSISNSLEAELVMALLLGLFRLFPSTVNSSIAILTPYKSQLSELRYAASSALRDSQMQNVEIATVDGFQGKEADVVFFSCVRARGSGQSSSIGFLADVRRMNVALTRARRGMYIIGHEDTLSKSPPWAAIIQHARRTNCLFTVEEPFESLLSFTTAELVGGDQDRTPLSSCKEPGTSNDVRTSNELKKDAKEPKSKKRTLEKGEPEKRLVISKRPRISPKPVSKQLVKMTGPDIDTIGASLGTPPPPPPLPPGDLLLGPHAMSIDDPAVSALPSNQQHHLEEPPPLPPDLPPSPPPLPESLPFSQPPLPTDTPPD